ncbi:RDD family protein [Microbacterium marinilacus]|uniref:FHA domain-containing protein n=1 Tax=Microbacterium marinilacus TaxID=415209 RepID=A0ABP7BHK8_9MICO|nr:RDD family protein [Microbacterium marinilacus]MBY0689496.1 RDD family protein [Microbacterium marinilacus]
MTTPHPSGGQAPGARPGPAPAPGQYPGQPIPPQPWQQAPAAPQAPVPAPAPPAPMPGLPARLGRRAAAYAIDLGIVAAAYAVLFGLAMLLGLALGPVVLIVMSGVIGLLAIAWIVVYSLMQGGQGSIGMRLMRLRLVRLEDGAPLGMGGALIRNVIWGLAGAIVVGLFSVLFDRSGRNQGWHDKVSHAFMADARGGHANAGHAAPADVSRPAAPRSPVPSRVPPVSPVAPAYSAVPAMPAAPSATAAPSAAPGGSALAPAPAFDGAIPPRPPLPPRPPAPAASPAPAAPPAASPVPPAPPAADDDLIAFVPGITQDPPAVSAPAAIPESRPAAAPAPAEPAEPVAPGVDGDTVHVPREAEDVEATRLVVRTPSAILEWDDGNLHTVTGRAVFGRNPAVEAEVTAYSVRDETLSLSKTHFEVEVTTDGAFVIDRHSTNGVTIVRAGRRIDAAPGEHVALEPGDSLEIGDRIVSFKALGRAT